MLKFSIQTLVAASAALASFGVMATPGNGNGGGGNTPTLMPCKTSDVTVTSVWRSDGSLVQPPGSGLLPAAKSSAECVGAYTNNAMPIPSTNRGYYGDGLFNGAAQNVTGTVLFPNGAFSDQYTAYDLNNDGIKDPGWVYLGKWENGSFSFSALATQLFTAIAPQYGKDYWGNVATNLFSITGGTGNKGQWSFNVPTNAVTIMEQVFGGNLFDQFALSFFAGNTFAAYDITAAEFGIPVQPDPLYSFGGTWDMSGTLVNNGGQGAALSHIDLYVRDPLNPNQTHEVPEPTSVALVAISLLGLAAARSRRRPS